MLPTFLSATWATSPETGLTLVCSTCLSGILGFKTSTAIAKVRKKYLPLEHLRIEIREICFQIDPLIAVRFCLTFSNKQSVSRKVLCMDSLFGFAPDGVLLRCPHASYADWSP